MSTKINMLLIALALFSLTSISFAYNPQCGGPGQGRGPGGGGFRVAQILNLTSEQQQEFQNIMQEQRKIGQAWREKHHQETEAKLGQILNEEQLKKFKEFKQNRPNKMGMGFNRPNNYGRGMRQ
jgi:Spy/CpxP family protein refolding chaperone